MKVTEGKMEKAHKEKIEEYLREFGKQFKEQEQRIQRLEAENKKLKNFVKQKEKAREDAVDVANEMILKNYKLEAQIADFRQNELKYILDEIERGCFKTQKEVLFEVIRTCDEVFGEAFSEKGSLRVALQNQKSGEKQREGEA